MTKKKNRIPLKGKMSNWGPFGESEGQWLIFTVGNPNEGHGLALPRMIDDLPPKYVAHRVEFRTGSRYVAHIPYTTDRVGDVAKDWAPSYLPMAQFVDKVGTFLQFHLKELRELKLQADKVMIIVGHGGNADLKHYTKDMKQQLGLKELKIISTAGEQLFGEISNGLEKIAERLIPNGTEEEVEEKAYWLFQLVTSGGHASHMEHSIAAAMNVLDWDKLEEMNNVLEKDFEKGLENWPPIGGLGGFLIRNGEYTKALGTKKNDKYGLWHCLEGLKNIDNGKLHPIKEIGELVLEKAIDYFSSIIKNSENN